VMVIATLAILVVAAAALAASSASFTAHSANAGNSFSAGIMQMGNDKSGAIMTAGPMLPGKDYTGTVKITNIGDAAGAFTLKAVDLQDPTKGTAGAKLSDTLKLKVVDENDFEVYNGYLKDFPAVGKSCGDPFPAGQFHTYTFTVTFPDTDLGTAGNDNKYQGCKTTVEFDWDSVSQ